MQEIKKLIEHNELKMAKEKITNLEIKLSEEPSLYLQNVLKEQITDLKKLYFSKLNHVLLNTKENISEKIVKIENIVNNEKTTDKDCLKNEFDKTIESFNVIDMIIDHCKNIKINRIESTGTISIRNTSESVFNCLCKNIRILNCSNITVNMLESSNIYLQDCTSIEINCKKSKCEVFDFSSPFNSTNYVLNFHVE